MLLFIQMVAINLIISCDNVGVIALAVRGLSKEKANLARRLGITLSFVLKLLFIAIVGFLFELPWLHIRIIGGVLLLYVTFNMLKPASCEESEANEATCTDRGATLDLAVNKKNVHSRGNFIPVIISIVAADLSMSLDNVIAILSLVSKDSNELGINDILFIAAGLLICIPILLKLSSTVSALMEKYYLLTCICAGYLVYIAMNMIFQDATLAFFFKKINFTLTTPTAILFGLMVLLYELFKKDTPFNLSHKSLKNMFMLSFLVELHGLITLAGISYLSTNPLEGGRILSLNSIYNFSVSGVNTIYILSRSYELIVLCCAFYIGSISQRENLNLKNNYFCLLKKAYRSMLVFVSMEYLTLAIGLTIMFGYGEFNLLQVLISAMEYLIILSTYVSVFCMVTGIFKIRSTNIALGVVTFYTEHVLVAICKFGNRFQLLAGFLPGYYLYRMPMHAVNSNFLLKSFLLAFIINTTSSLIGKSLYDNTSPKCIL